MKLIRTKIHGLYLIKPELFEDKKRGTFLEEIILKKFLKKIIYYSKSDSVTSLKNFKRGTLRGFHYQRN